MAPVHHETRVFFRYLSIPDPIAPKASLVDERRCKISWRSLESASRAGEIQRLFLYPFPGQFSDAFSDGIRVIPGQFQVRRKDDVAAVHHGRVAVPEIHSFPVQQPDIAFSADHFDLTNQIADFSPIGSRIHEYSPTQAAGDAGSKFQSGQSSFCGSRSQARKQDPGFHLDGAAVHSKALQGIAQFQDNSPDPLIQHQQIRTVADDCKRDTLPVDFPEQAAYLFLGLGDRQEIGGPSHPEGGVPIHGSIDLVFSRKLFFQERKQCGYTHYSIASFRVSPSVLDRSPIIIWNRM